jgi:hypothetical protein
VKITYPLATIWAVRAEAEDNGHRFKGQGAEVRALVRAHLHPVQAQRGHHPSVVPLGDEVRGIPLMSKCGE